MMSVVVILVLLETVRFLIKDKSETLSSKYVCRTKPTPQNYKIFCSGQHSRGYCPANFQKQPVINTIAEKRVFLCTETDVSNALYEQENPENHLPGAGLPADGAVDRTDRYGLSGTRRRGGIGGFGPGGYLLPDDLHAGIRVQHRRPDSHRPPQRSQGVFADRPSVHAKYGVPAVDGPRAVHPLESLRSPHHGALIEAPDVREAAVRYLDYRVYGFFFAYVGSMFRAFYVGTTRTRILTINSIVMVLTNVVLNYLLIFGKFGFPEMGIAGAAIASSISEGVSALFYILYTRYRTDWRRYKFRFTGFDFSLQKQILSLSVWVMIQQGVAFLAWFLFFLCIEHLGKRDLAATNIVRAVSSLIFMFINAFASTASSLVSNLLGAGYAEQIMPLCRKMIRLCFCFVLPLCILAAAIPYWTLRIYTDDVSLIEYAIPSLWVMLTTNIPCTAAFIYQFSVSGTGNTRTALTIVACTSIVYVAYTALLVYGLHADVALCWTADHVYYGCTLTASYLYMRYGNWRARKI